MSICSLFAGPSTLARCGHSACHNLNGVHHEHLLAVLLDHHHPSDQHHARQQELSWPMRPALTETARTGSIS